MGQTGLSLGLTVWILNIYHGDPESRVPSWIRSLLPRQRKRRKEERDRELVPGTMTHKSISPKQSNGVTTPTELECNTSNTKAAGRSSSLPSEGPAIGGPKSAEIVECPGRIRNRQEWILASRALDRLCMWCMLTLTVAEISVFVVTLGVSYSKYN